MPDVDAIKNELEKIQKWSLISHKNKLIKQLSFLLHKDDVIVDMIEGFYTSKKVTKEYAGCAGTLFLTTNKLIFASTENGSHQIINRDQILSTHIAGGFSSYKLSIVLKNETINLRSFASKPSIETFITLLGTTTTDGNNQGKLEEYNYLNGFDILSQNNTLEKFSKQLSQFLERTEKTPSAKKDKKPDSDFLLAEAQKVYHLVKPLLNYPTLKKDIISDFTALASLCLSAKNEIGQTNALFLTLTLVLLDEDPTSTTHISLLKSTHFTQDIDEFTISHNKYLSALIQQHETSVPLLTSLSHIDQNFEGDTTQATDLLRNALQLFSQCLVKADGTVSKEDELILRNIQSLLFNSSIVKPTSTITPIAPHVPLEKPTRPIKVETLEEVLSEIDELVGMDNIKTEIQTFINVIKIRQEREKHNLPITPVSLHSVFYGPPGTGKTTIARILGRVFKCLGLLTKGHLVETDRAGLVAGYVGQTAIKTDEKINESLDGILFIDEAYALAGGDAGKDFGQEAIDTILKRMEDHRERLVIIVAGYPDEMRQFIHSNPGLKSRFSRYFNFDHYSPQELMDIFEIFSTKSQFKIETAAKEKLLELLTEYHNCKDRTFGNGRLVRNLFEKIMEQQANRLASISPLTEQLLSTILIADIPEKEEMM